MRLTEKGLVRWYARCCNTPIGNTVADYRVSFVGLVHSCLESPHQSLNDSFGPESMWSCTKRASPARTKVNASSFGMAAGIIRLIAMVLGARLNGAYKRTPFFLAGAGEPIVTPKILTTPEREALYKAIG